MAKKNSGGIILTKQQLHTGSSTMESLDALYARLKPRMQDDRPARDKNG